jgi:hypothetical protein
VRNTVKYGMKKTLSILTKEDQDIHNLINVYNSLKKEEKEVMKTNKISSKKQKKKPPYS